MEKTTDCSIEYDLCFSSCSGTINIKRVCVENCEVGEILEKYKEFQLAAHEKEMLELIKKHLDGVSSDVHVAPNISPNKLDGYLKKLAKLADSEDLLLAQIDTTFFGGGSDGYAFFGDYFIYTNT